MTSAPPDSGVPSRPSDWVWRAGLGLAIALVLGLLVYQGVLEARREKLVKEGTPAPAFTAEDINGGRVQLEAYRGKVLMIDFWATWCPPCVSELPALVKVAGEYQGRVELLAADRIEADDPARVTAFVQRRLPKLAPNVHVVLVDEATVDRYQVHAIPTLYFVDPQGRVGDAATGAVSEDTIRSRIEDAIAAAKSSSAPNR